LLSVVFQYWFLFFPATLALVDLPYAVVNICLHSVFDLTARCWLLLSRQWMQKE
jgi:hypothetical protein